MSSILRMPSERSAAIAQSFDARAGSYEEHADLQRAVAERLAQLLPPFRQPRALEFGCGTGLFSRHLLARYPGGTFVLTDLAPSMVEQCRRNVAGVDRQRVSFDVMDAARPTTDGPFDLIATSMTLHWLADPAGALSTLRTLLAPNGMLIYATISAKSFPEWRDVLAAQGLPVGLLDIPELPGIVDEERIVADDTLGFLRRMKAIGGLTPREGYAPMPAGALRRAIRAADGKHGGRITWHIVYGGVVASQSSPSISPA